MWSSLLGRLQSRIGADRARRSAQVLIQALEERQHFAASFPTAQEQYLVELINRARANPTAEVSRLSSTGSTPTALSRSGWTVTASNNPEGTGALTDGNAGTRWSSNAAMAPGMFIQIDLGSAQAFNRLEMDSTGSPSDFAASYSIYTSDTGDDWDTKQPISTGNGLSPKITVVFSSQTARYIRIVQNGTKPEGWWWSIHELNVLNSSAGSIAGWGGTPDLNEGLPANTITADAKQPVAVNPFLTDAARDHATWMRTTGVLSHNETRAGYTTPTDRAVTAGYPVPAAPPTFYVGENIFFSSGASDQQAYVDQMHAGLFIDNIGPAGNSIAARGHRGQMLNPLAKLIGVGHSFDGNIAFSSEKFTNVNNTRAYLTGVAYNDTNSNSFYTPGEGLGSVTITATRLSDQQVFTTTTWDAGGYTLELPEGGYTVTASGGGIGTPIPQTITIGTQNVKVDWAPRDTPPPPPAAAAPTILQQPTDKTVQSTSILDFASGPVSFSTSATGTPAPTFQWQSAPAGGTFTDIPGATSAVYTFTPVAGDSGKQYRAVVTNSGGSVNTNAATLNLTGVGTFLSTRPQDQTVTVGSTVTLTSAAKGLNLAIKWESLQTGPGSNYSVINGATSPNYTFTATPDMAGKTFFYRVTYTNTRQAGFDASAVAIITVNAAPTAPTVIANPTSTAATAGGTATLAAAATGFPAADVQWQVADPQQQAQSIPSNGRAIIAQPAGDPVYTDVPGLTGSTVTFPVTSEMNGQRYRAVFTSPSGTVVTQEVVLTVNDDTITANELLNLRKLIDQAKEAIADCKATVRADAGVLTQNLLRLNATRAQRKLVSTLLSNESKARKNLDKQQSKVFKSLLKDVARADKLYRRLQAEPTDSKSQTKLTAVIARLQSTVDNNTVPADATRCQLAIKAQLDPIVSVAPTDTQLQSEVARIADGTDVVGQKLQAPMAFVKSLITRLNNSLQA